MLVSVLGPALFYTLNKKSAITFNENKVVFETLKTFKTFAPKVIEVQILRSVSKSFLATFMKWASLKEIILVLFVTDYFSGNSWFGKKHTRHYVWQHWCSFGTRGFLISDVQPLFTALVNSTLAVSFEPVTHHGTEASLFVSEMNELVSLPPSCDGCDHNTKRSLLRKNIILEVFFLSSAMI